MATTIINEATYNAEYAHKTSSSLMFPAEMFECLHYVDTAKLRKKFNLKGRGKVIHILLRNMDDPLFVNTANRDICYKSRLCVDKNMDGAVLCEYGMWVTSHPIGDAIIVLKE